MTKILLTTLFLLEFGFSFGQDFTYPNINMQGKELKSFIPKGWTLLDSVKGDLNKDNHNDLVLILQYKDSVTLKNIDNDTVRTQPRILVVLLFNKAINQYQLLESSNSFILNHDNPNMEEPYKGISINTGILKIDFEIFMNMGGWGMSNNSYLFRFQDKALVLIGADYNYLHRGSGETESRSYNFLTKKVKVSTGTIESNKRKVILRTIKIKELKTFRTFIQPFTWEVEENYYL